MPPSAFRELDWYETPEYYDIVFDAGTEREADFLEAVRAEYGKGRGRRVLEPACGSGRLVEAMARRGWRVTGFDLSPAMLDYARARLTRAGVSARALYERMKRYDLRKEDFRPH